MSSSKLDSSLMATAPKAVVHLRAQHRRKRLGLIFGSGASKDLGFPDWTALVRDIAADAKVDAKELLKSFQAVDGQDSPLTKSLSSITQMLFSHFRFRQVQKLGVEGPLTFLQEQSIRSEWLRIIHERLYNDIDPKKRRQTMNGHPYLSSFKDIIKQSPMTVNYNFDDTLEKLLIGARDVAEQETTRGYEVVDRPNAQFQKDSSVIYHPNGFLPSEFSDGASADVVFSDDAFQDQLVSAATGKYMHLSNHLFKNTCLLVGLSLEDATLQSLLRQNAVSNSGHIHYIIHYAPKGKKRDKQAEKVIFEANFSSFNLYTLFLDGDGIRDLANTILLPESTFKLKNPGCALKFVYYLTGAIGSGKSTAAGNFRNLTTYDEWIDERLPDLAKPQKAVSKAKVPDMDAWIRTQFKKKNFALQEQDEGIHLVDRCPLDPLTFGTKEERPPKAKKLLEEILSKDDGWKVQEGHIIHLDCDVGELTIRNSYKHKYWAESEIGDLLNNIEDVYGPLNPTKICTRGRTANEVAREVAKVVFLEEYKPVDIGLALKEQSVVGSE